MLTRIRTIRPGDAVGLMIVGAVVALVLSGTAFAITDTNFTYSTIQTGRLTIPPRDLAPANDESANADYAVTITRLTANRLSCFVTGIHLPEQAKITNLQTYYSSGASSNVSVELQRQELATNAVAHLVSYLIGDDSATRKSVTNIPPSTLRMVNNNLYAYSFQVCLGPGDSFSSSRLTYQYSTAGA